MAQPGGGRTDKMDKAVENFLKKARNIYSRVQEVSLFEQRN